MAFSAPVNAMSPYVAKGFEWNVRLHAANRTKYVWGKFDCSYLVYESAIKAGARVQRIPARDIYRGVGGWTGWNYDSLRDGSHLDLAFFTSGTKPYRHDHVGILLQGPSGWELAHASGKAGCVVIQKWNSYPGSRKWSDGFRRLTLGE